MSESYTKRPQDRLDYDVDFSKWLSSSDGIASHTVTIATGTTVTSDESAVSGQTVKVWLLGGADGDNAQVTVKIITNEGRNKEVCFRLQVREKC